jgi:hypothetical protein
MQCHTCVCHTPQEQDSRGYRVENELWRASSGLFNGTCLHSGQKHLNSVLSLKDIRLMTLDEETMYRMYDTFCPGPVIECWRSAYEGLSDRDMYLYEMSWYSTREAPIHI